MVRTQIQLTDEQARALKRIAMERHQSVASIIRECVDRVTRSAAVVGEEERRARALALIGRFSSDVNDLGEEHDKYFIEAVTGE